MGETDPLAEPSLRLNLSRFFSALLHDRCDLQTAES
jgi:hypothetical protein